MIHRVCRLDKCREDEPDEPCRRTTTADDHEGHDDDAMQPARRNMRTSAYEEARNEADSSSVDRVQPANIEGELRRGLRQGHDNAA
mgnify:FL=1